MMDRPIQKGDVLGWIDNNCISTLVVLDDAVTYDIPGSCNCEECKGTMFPVMEIIANGHWNEIFKVREVSLKHWKRL